MLVTEQDRYRVFRNSTNRLGVLKLLSVADSDYRVEFETALIRLAD